MSNVSLTYAHHQVGYKEGLDEGKALTIQQGFDEGASLSSLWQSCCPPGCLGPRGAGCMRMSQGTGAGQAWGTSRG